MTTESALQQWKRIDDARESYRGEHWMTLGAGIAALAYGMQRRSRMSQFIATAIGAGLIARAASGRDGIAPFIESMKASIDGTTGAATSPDEPPPPEIDPNPAPVEIPAPPPITVPTPPPPPPIQVWTTNA